MVTKTKKNLKTSELYCRGESAAMISVIINAIVKVVDTVEQSTNKVM